MIFMTGGTGLAGTFALKELVSRGTAVKALTRKAADHSEFPAPVEKVWGDLASPAELRQLAQNNRGIVHYACASIGKRAPIQVDIDAMAALVAKWEHGPFTFISSLDVYGWPKTTEVDETCPLSGEISEYSQGKIECEKVLTDAARVRGRNDFSILRASWIFSPHARSWTHLLNRFLKARETQIFLPGETEAEWPKFADAFIDARDLAWLAAESLKKPVGGAANALTEKFSWHDLFTHLIKLTGSSSQIVHRKREELSQADQELFGQQYSFSNAKVKAHFGFAPRYHWPETVESAFRLVNFS
jgi:nucleoside-diphosphate-sugar epimerase